VDRASGGGAPSLGTLEVTLRKALDTGISLHRGSFTTERNMESGGGLIDWGLYLLVDCHN